MWSCVELVLNLVWNLSKIICSKLWSIVKIRTRKSKSIVIWYSFQPGYLVGHVISKFFIIINFSSSYYLITNNHPAIGLFAIPNIGYYFRPLYYTHIVGGCKMYIDICPKQSPSTFSGLKLQFISLSICTLSLSLSWTPILVVLYIKLI